MKSKYRIVKGMYDDGEIYYTVQQKKLFYWGSPNSDILTELIWTFSNVYLRGIRKPTKEEIVQLIEKQIFINNFFEEVVEEIEG